MRVRLVSFGPLRASLPVGGRWCELPAASLVETLLSHLRDEGIFTAAQIDSAAVAINREYASRHALLHDGDEVAILPPVSGGTGDPPLIALVREPIDDAAIVASVKTGSDGAVVVFDGIVRDNTRGRQTLYLDYDAYEEMALRQLRLLRAEAIQHHGVREVAIVHRLGRLVIGETSVLIVVASAHRAAAFEACRWVIDTLKTTVPIWKKEQFVDGVVWVDGEPFPQDVLR